MRISGTLDDVVSSAHELLSLALKAGAEEAEVYGLWGRSLDVDLRKDLVELASESFYSGLGLRAVIAGAVGFSSTSDLTKLPDVAEGAVRAARARGGDPEWISLPFPEAPSLPEKIFDPAIDAIETDDCLQMAGSLLRGLTEIPGAQPVSGGVSASTGVDFIVNSRGIALSEKGTSMHASMEAISRSGGAAVTGGEFFNSRLLKKDLDNVGRVAAEIAVSSVNGIKAETGEIDVILKPLAFVELLEYTFAPSISGDNVLKGRSALAGKVGEEIASRSLSIIDDGLMPGGMGTSAFDGEGVPSRRTPVVEDGILRGFLYDSYTAGKGKTASTGNAVRSGYSEVPRVGTRNLIVSSKDAFDLYSEIKGVMVHSVIGAHTANPISGDFSVEAKNAYYISPGEAARPIRSMMIAGNAFEILKSLRLGTDIRMVGSVVLPSAAAKMKVVGS